MNTYKQFRNEVTKLIRKSKKSNIDEIANKLKTENLAVTTGGNYCNRLLNPDIPTPLKDDIIYSSDREKANILNDHFIGQTNRQGFQN